MTSQEKNAIELQENNRARKAWSYVQDIKNKGLLEKYKKDDKEKFEKEYRSCVLKLPVLILTNGLGQTLAFLKSKGKGKIENAYEKAYQDIQGWLFSEESKLNWGNPKSKDLLERVINLPSERYRHVTSETLAYLNWLKRFADANLKGEEDEDEQS